MSILKGLLEWAALVYMNVYAATHPDWVVKLLIIHVDLVNIWLLWKGRIDWAGRFRP